MPDAPSARLPRRRLPIAIALLVAAAGVLAAITIIAVGEEGEAIEITGVNETQQLLGGITQDGAELGSPQAPVTISIFNDLQCSACASYQLATVPPLIDEFVRGGGARLDFRHFSVGPREAGVSYFAAVAAGEQERQWQFIHLLYLNQDELGPGGVTDEFLSAIAAGVNVEVDQWLEDRDSPEVAEQVEADAELARELRLPAEPAVVVDGPGGTRTLTESPSVQEIEEAVEAVR